MHNTYSPWGELALRADLSLEWGHLVGRMGEYLHHERTIRLDARMPRRQARAVLAHELQHAAAGDEVTHCDRTNLRQEQRADRLAARLLIDVRDLGDAMMLHARHHSATAVELRVSDRLLAVRLDDLHPSERGYLRGRLEDGHGVV
ncbi:ImmA/IrrE family metallo-endopeptidase [Nocardioides sp.]|uniref:ImmA/IrrE family metallo-endopeptidase n=1 Tax=Nocardioides sp. TaxID=35761 RepID=UPI002C300EA2|nr:ImmA/IrrE family metallo-endopeptidase [Nocardioides sp.]HXH77279.1 ImmA/IrrE family metallo-endopeptidase [Nocardioides sp.]